MSGSDDRNDDDRNDDDQGGANHGGANHGGALNQDTAVSPADRGLLVQLVFGQMAAQVVAAAARLGLADLLGDAERTGAALAEASGTDAGSMTRLLRAMAACELLTETRPGMFRLTAAGLLLCTDRPDSLNAFVQMFSDPAMQAAWTELPSAVRTGRPTFDELFGTDFFGYLARHPELSERFNAAMRQGTQLTAAVLPTSYDFSRFDTVVDVGGGDGTLIAQVLRAHPGLRGILYDTVEGLAQADATLLAAGVADRCTTRSGDFFTEVPGGDCYLLKSVVHDWDDERAARILRHCRDAIPEHGRLLVVEPVLPDVVDGSLPATMYLSDLNMLVNVGGRERTRGDFDQLCRAAGFALAGIRPLPPPAAFSLIEAAPA